MIKATGKIRHKEAGMATLQLVLILVLVGGLILPVLLSLMMTASKAGQMEERKTLQYYAADAGITSALWRIQNLALPETPQDLNQIYWPEAFYTATYDNYTLSHIGASDNINGNGVVYKITPKWVLEGIETPNTTQKRTPPPEPAAITVAGFQGTGSVPGRSSYKIVIKYNDTAGVLGIKRIGCWLPGGFEYITGSSSLEQNQNKPYYKVPIVTAFRGGHTITWDYNPPLAYNLFDPGGTQREVTFEFTGDRQTQRDFCWLSDNLTTSDKYLVWTNMKLFDITSVATDNSSQSTTITALSNRNDETPDQEGDYYAFGSTLMRDSTPTSGNNYRNRLYDNTTVTISSGSNGIPAGAHIEQVLLYWSGWKCKPWDVTTGYNQAALNQLPVTYNVNKVELKVTAAGFPSFSENITAPASKIQGAISTLNGAAMGWCYSCAADITTNIRNTMGTDFTGNGTYTVGHWDTSKTGSLTSTTYRYPVYSWATNPANDTQNMWTRYPLGSPGDGQQRAPSQYLYEDGSAHDAAYSAWSIVIIYTSPTTRGHQIYVSDNFTFIQQTVPKEVTISGFLVPELIAGENAARYTHFVGEGDLKSGSNYQDSVSVKGPSTAYVSLSDAYNPANDICNNLSVIPPGSGTTINGIDIDTFSFPQGVVQAGDTSAKVKISTVNEGLNLIYVILSFRSILDTGGASIYYIR